MVHPVIPVKSHPRMESFAFEKTAKSFEHLPFFLAYAHIVIPSPFGIRANPTLSIDPRRYLSPSPVNTFRFPSFARVQRLLELADAVYPSSNHVVSHLFHSYPSLSLKLRAIDVELATRSIPFVQSRC